MRRETITKEKIITLTQTVLHGFYGRNVEHLDDYLSDDFVWIGAFDYQYTTTKQQFLQTTQSEMEAIPFLISDESYDLVSRDRDTFVVCCRLHLHNHTPEGKTLQMHTRLTLIWRHVGDDLLLTHVHGSNAQDIPLVEEETEPEVDSADFINYITGSVKPLPTPKIMFRLHSGAHHFVHEEDIFYLQAHGKQTILHSRQGDFIISGLLRNHETALSERFFRIHKSHLINLDYLTAMQRYEATLYNALKLPIGKEKYLALREQFQGHR